MKDYILNALEEIQDGYTFCGVIDRRGRIYPLGLDTKVISTLFELVSRQAVAAYAESEGLEVIEPSVQNHYPDFTLRRDEEDHEMIAIDVKTTYRRNGRSKFTYTLGSYTSFIVPGQEGKNIAFPYNHYAQHWVIGFSYDRAEVDVGQYGRIYSAEELAEIPIPFENVEVFMQEKWRITGDRAGSGNTTNMASIHGTITDFIEGNGPFRSEEEYLEYWRGYRRTADERNMNYSNINQFRELNERYE